MFSVTAICQGLAQLQDRVPPFAEQDAMAIIRHALGEQSLAAFKHIESRPMASASIAQVHSARLITGEAVVIKVVRPNIEGQIRREMGALIDLAAWLAQRSAHPPTTAPATNHARPIGRDAG